MGVFRFKGFEVRNEDSAMKVNTDGVLLGAVTDVFPKDRRVLDVGTGTGVVALMVSQRLSSLTPEFSVQGLDVDRPSALEAAFNFAGSPWREHLSAHCCDFLGWDGGEYDLIVSNPPFFDNSLKAPDGRRCAARHTGLSYREILQFSETHLSPGGRVSMILPSQVEADLLRYGRMCGLVPWKLLRIRTVETKDPSRLIVQFARKGALCHAPGELTLTDGKGRRTSQHASLLTDYLL